MKKAILFLVVAISFCSISTYAQNAGTDTCTAHLENDTVKIKASNGEFQLLYAFAKQNEQTNLFCDLYTLSLMANNVSTSDTSAQVSISVPLKLVADLYNLLMYSVPRPIGIDYQADLRKILKNKLENKVPCVAASLSMWQVQQDNLLAQILSDSRTAIDKQRAIYSRNK